MGCHPAHHFYAGGTPAAVVGDQTAFFVGWVTAFIESLGRAILSEPITENLS